MPTMGNSARGWMGASASAVVLPTVPGVVSMTLFRIVFFVALDLSFLLPAMMVTPSEKPRFYCILYNIQSPMHIGGLRHCNDFNTPSNLFA